MSERNGKAIRYRCGCTADGDMVSPRCPIHGERDEQVTPEHGPIVPSPMIDLETMAEYERAVRQFEARKDVPR